MKRSRVLLLSAAIVACESKSGSDDAAGDTSTSSEGNDATESGGPSETETDSGTEETETGEPEPDLPPEQTCVAWDAASSFDQLCFGAPVVVDPTPVSVVEAVYGGRYYVGGPGVHRIYDEAELVAGGSYTDLALPGTPIAAERLPFFFGEGTTLPFVIVTKDPHAVILLDFAQDGAVMVEVPLDAEPTAYARFLLDISMAIAIADVDANLLVFEPEMQSLSLTATRTLPEPLDVLDATWGWFASGSQLLGRSDASQTAYLLQPEIPGDGPIDAYPFANAIATWEVGHALNDTSDRMLLFSTDPSQVVRVDALDFDAAGMVTALEHPVDLTGWGEVPVDESFGAEFGLSSSDARLGLLGVANGESLPITAPASWIEVAANTVDFLPIGPLGFLCASTSEGLTLVSPTP